MHRERVERHCKGVITSLNEFKARFQEMVEEHDKEASGCARDLDVTFCLKKKRRNSSRVLCCELNILTSTFQEMGSLSAIPLPTSWKVPTVLPGIYPIPFTYFNVKLVSLDCSCPSTFSCF